MLYVVGVAANSTVKTFVAVQLESIAATTALPLCALYTVVPVSKELWSRLVALEMYTMGSTAGIPVSFE